MAKKTARKVVYDTEYRYRLEPYRGRGNSKHTCPRCRDTRKTFVRYIDITDGSYIDDGVGKCDRTTACGLHTPPTSDNLKGKSLIVNSNEVDKRFLKPQVTNVIDHKFVSKSLSGTDNFSTFLFSNFPKDVVARVLNNYKVGSSDLWPNATIFWQIDSEYDVRTGKVMLYNRTTGKRIKEQRRNYISWVHSPMKNNCFGDNHNYELKQCFFGEHLLEPSRKVVRVVESEKTAILCTIANPDTYWIATGGIELISAERLMPYKDKELIFYPDKGKAFSKWEERLNKVASGFNYKLDTNIEGMDLEEGDDLGDYIIKKKLNVK